MSKPVLYLMLGFPGAGKTTAALVIHELTGAVHLWADKIRNERYSNPTHSHKENLELYNYLNEVTEELLKSGKDVIFDTNFNFYKDREHLRTIASSNGAITRLIWVTTPKFIAKERATIHSHQDHTRVWGNMPIKDFDRISSNLQPPRPGENSIEVDGTKISREYIKQKLNL